MFRKIAIPLDGSAFAERILNHLPRLGTPEKLEVLLIRVVEPLHYYSYVAPDAIHLFDAAMWRENAYQYLKMMAHQLRKQGYTASISVGDGDIAATIQDIAVAHDADLIAMTTHGRSGMQRWLLGSVADRVVRTASLPVYLVRPGREIMSAGAPQRLLVPLDGSMLAETALASALKLMEGRKAELWLVQAVEISPLWGEKYISPEMLAALPSLEEQERVATEYLEKVAAPLRAEGHQVFITLGTGNAAQVVADTVTERAIDTVVMSTHGRSGLNRWVFGSVADKVMRLVECPVLLVRVKSVTVQPEPPVLASVNEG